MITITPRASHLIVLAFFFLGIILRCQAQTGTPPADYAARVKVLEGNVTGELSKLETGLQAEKPEQQARDLAAAALVYAMRDHDLEKSRQMLETVFALQDMNPASSGYGTFSWFQNHPEHKDPNAIEFTCESLAPLFLRYGSEFSPDFQSEAAKHLVAAVSGIRHHLVNGTYKISVNYTNIFLMKLTNLILLGEYLHDQATVDAGKALLDQWIQYTRQNGISEFGSPGYGGVQYTVISSLYNNVQDPLIQAKAKLMLDYYWVDYAGNYFPAREDISGPSSRTYSPLGDVGGISGAYYLFGVANKRPDVYPLSEAVMIWEDGVWGKYRPDANILALADLPERVVQARWGLEPGMDRYNYITPDFAIGSSSRYYGPQDRDISLQLSSTKRIPFISVVPDTLDAPYKATSVGTPGHRMGKIQYALSTAQEKGALLALLDLSQGLQKPAAASATMPSVATNVILPYLADGLFIDGKKVDWSSDSIPVSDQTTIGVLEGTSGVAIRLFHADPLADGSAASFFLKDDGKDLTDLIKDYRNYPSARLVAYHSDGKGQAAPFPKNVRSGVFIQVATCKSPEAFQSFLNQAKQWTFVEKAEGNIWQVTACPPKGSDSLPVLMASLDLSKKETGPRTVNGKEISSSLMTINDKDWAEEIWKPLGPLPPPPIKPPIGAPLITDGGFENGITGLSSMVAAGMGKKNCRFDIVSDNPHSGTSCLRLQSDDFARFAVNTSPGSIPVQPGERYHVSVWFRADPAAQASPQTPGFLVRLTLSLGDASAEGGHLHILLGNKVTRTNAVLSSNVALPTEWTHIEAVVEIPTGVDAMMPQLFAWKTKGAIFADDFSIERVDDSTPVTMSQNHPNP